MPFPNSPVDGQIYTEPVSQKNFVYSATNSIWEIKERRTIPEYSSTDTSLQSPVDGQKITSTAGNDYSSTVLTVGESVDFIDELWPGPVSTYLYESGSVGEITTNGTVMVGGYAGTTVSPGGTISALNTHKSGLSNLNNSSWVANSANKRALAFTFKYSGPRNAALRQIRTLQISGLPASVHHAIISTNKHLDLSGYSSSTINQHPEVVSYTQENTIANSTIARWTPKHNCYLQTGKVYTVFLWCTSGSLSVKAWDLTNMDPPVGFDFYYPDFPSISNYDSQIATVQSITQISGASTYLPIFFEIDCIVEDGVVNGTGIKPYIQIEDWFGETGGFGGQHLESVAALPITQPWPGYPDGYAVFNTLDSKIYHWDSGTSSWLLSF